MKYCGLHQHYLTLHHSSGSFAQFFPAFEKQGFYDWKAKVAGQPIAVKVTPDMFDEFIAYDTTFVNDQTKFPNVGDVCLSVFATLMFKPTSFICRQRTFLSCMVMRTT